MDALKEVLVLLDYLLELGQEMLNVERVCQLVLVIFSEVIPLESKVAAENALLLENTLNTGLFFCQLVCIDVI